MEKLTIKISSKSKAFMKQYAKSQNKSVSQVFDDLLESFIKKERERIRREKRLNQTKDTYEQQVNSFLTGLFTGAQK